jgi:adenylosuccinate lyase
MNTTASLTAIPDEIGGNKVLLEDKFVCEKLSEKDLIRSLEPRNYLGTAVRQAETFAREDP